LILSQSLCILDFEKEDHYVKHILGVVKRNPLFFHSISYKNNGFLFTTPNIMRETFIWNARLYGYYTKIKMIIIDSERKRKEIY